MKICWLLSTTIYGPFVQVARVALNPTMSSPSEYEPSDNEDKKPAAKETESGKRKRRQLKPVIFPRQEGESEPAHQVRRQKGYRKRHTKKKKDEKKHLFDKTMAASLQPTEHDDDDFFIKKVVGSKNFLIKNADKKHTNCTTQVKKRLIVSQSCTRKYLQDRSWEKRNVVPHPYFQVGFHIDPDRDVGDKGTVNDVKEIRKFTVYPWLIVKESGIAGAGLGCFADREFKQGQFVGFYMGSTKGGHPNNAISGDVGKITCHSFSSSDCWQGRGAATMGMQMMNDPTMTYDDGNGGNGGDNESHGFDVNCQVQSDMFVRALRDIARGEEMFLDHQLEDDGGDEDGGDEVNDTEKASGGSKGGDEDQEEDGCDEHQFRV